MPHVHEANVACGLHAGDPQVMRRTLALAQQHGVAVGAHPSYDDAEHFGRRSMSLPAEQITALIHYQVGALEGVAASLGLVLRHIKPHGGLYNDMMANATTRAAVMRAVASYHRPLPLVMLATTEAQQHREEADAAGITVVFEAFADRAYTDEGRLQPRSEAGAVLDRDAMLEQVRRLCAEGTVVSVSGKVLAVPAETLCVHGDNAEGVAAIAAIRALVDAH